MVFEEFVCLFLGGVEVPFRIGQMAVEGIAQNLLEMSETLLVANDLDVIRPTKILQLLDFLGGEGIGGCDVGVAFGLEGVLGIEREGIELAFSHLWDKAFQVVHTDDGTSTDVVLPGANLEVGPVGDGHARDADLAFVAEERVSVELFQALRGVEKPRVGGGLHADEALGDGQPIGLVLVFAHAETVGLDELDVVLAFGDAACEQDSLWGDLLQVAAPHGDDLVDFGIGSIVGEDDILVPNKLTLSGFDLLWGGEDMGVLCSKAQCEKAK